MTQLRMTTERVSLPTRPWDEIIWPYRKRGESDGHVALPPVSHSYHYLVCASPFSPPPATGRSRPCLPTADLRGCPLPAACLDEFPLPLLQPISSRWRHAPAFLCRSSSFPVAGERLLSRARRQRRRKVQTSSPRGIRDHERNALMASQHRPPAPACLDGQSQLWATSSRRFRRTAGPPR
jgi:hypothetical protein